MSQGLNELHAKYSRDPENPFECSRTIAFSTKISVAAKNKLDALSMHVGTKKTPLFGEIAEAAINDLFDRLYDEMDEDLQHAYHQMEEEDQHQ
jgi:predicted DNA-binding protein